MMQILYEEATERGFCLVCLCEVVAGQIVHYTVFGPFHKDCSPAWGDR